MEEAVFGQSEFYNTGVICSSLKAELLYIDREFLTRSLTPYPKIWNALVDKSAHNYAQYVKSIKNMEKSNLKIIDTLKRDTNDDANTIECYVEEPEDVVYTPDDAGNLKNGSPRARSQSPISQTSD